MMRAIWQDRMCKALERFLVWNFIYIKDLDTVFSKYFKYSLLKVKVSMAEFKINFQLNPLIALVDFLPGTHIFLSLTT